MGWGRGCIDAGTSDRRLCGHPPACKVNDRQGDGDVRVTAALNRTLALARAFARDLVFGDERVILTVVLRPGAPVCSCCGARGLAAKEHHVERCH